jgi:hypothetical protein
VVEVVTVLDRLEAGLDPALFTAVTSKLHELSRARPSAVYPRAAGSTVTVDRTDVPPPEYLRIR